MRRSEKQIKDRAEIDSILNESDIIHIALSDDGQPYLFTVNFGYDGESIYFHCANDGKKTDIIGRNNAVCFQVVSSYAIVKNDTPCEWTCTYRSAVGQGTAEVLSDADKRAGLDRFMKSYVPDKTYDFNEDIMDSVTVVKINIDSVEGKQNV